MSFKRLAWHCIIVGFHKSKAKSARNENCLAPSRTVKDQHFRLKKA